MLPELGRQNDDSITSAERGKRKTHTILACVPAAGNVLPPLMVYPRKKCVPDKFKRGLFPVHFSKVVKADGCMPNCT